MEKKKYPIGAEHYTLYEEVGHGLNSSVYRALCIPHEEIVSVKIVDCERDKSDLSKISHEAQTMILVDHPNVLKSHCSFVSDHSLWVVMPYMTGGSCLHILKVAYPEGFKEVVIATILREVLKALDYLHDHGHIHRDVKAGNILIDSNGAIKLGDLGVSACLFDSGDRQRTRNTFVGTPCWMAPEVMEQLHGYDFKADIWSFGITALELAHGHAPFSKYPPMKVLLLTLQNAPPGLDYKSDDKFTKSFKQMIASCLVKDPLKRPSAKKLLKHSFFKQARSNDYIARTLLEGLPVLGDRLQALKRKDVYMLEQQQIPDGQKEKLSQNEYRRGISTWKFNLEDVKAQTSNILDEDSTSEKDLGGSSSSLSGSDRQGNQLQCQHSSLGQSSEAADIDGSKFIQSDAAPHLPAKSTVASYKGKYEISDDDTSTASSSHEQVTQNSSPRDENQVQTNLIGKPGLEISEIYIERMNLHSPTTVEGPSDSVTGPDFVLSTARGESTSSIDELHVLPTVEDMSSDTNSKGSKISANSDEPDEKVKQVVQQKGRFKVTSGDVDMEKVGSQNPALSMETPSDAALLSYSGLSLFPMLQSILHTNILQRDVILNLLKQFPSGDSKVDGGMSVSTTGEEKSLLQTMHDREKELVNEVTNLQWRLICAQEKLKKYKTANAKV